MNVQILLAEVDDLDPAKLVDLTGGKIIVGEYSYRVDRNDHQGTCLRVYL